MTSNLWTAFFAWLQRLVGEPARSFFYPLNVSNIPATGINVSFGNTEICNITAFNQSSSIPLTLTTRDDKGNSKRYTISPNAPLEVQLAQVASFTVTGTGGSILAYFTWPETIPASTTVINGPVTIAGDVTVIGSAGKVLQTDTSGNTLVVPQSLITLLPPSIGDTDSIALTPVTPNMTATAGTSSSGEITSISVSLSVTAGQIIGIAAAGDPYAAAGVTDSDNNSYTELLSTNGTYHTTFWYATASTSGTVTITVKYSSASYSSISAFAATSAGVGVTSASWNSANSSTPTGETTPTTTYTNSLAIGLVGFILSTAASISSPSGSGLTWDLIGSVESNSAVVVAQYAAAVGSPQAVSFEAVLSASDPWDAIIITLNPPPTTPQTLTLSVTAGDAIIVAAEMVTGTISSVTDSQGNSYTLQLAAVGGLNVYNGTASTTGTLTITVDFNGMCQEVVALDVAAPNGNPTVRINTTSTPLPPIPGTPTMIIAITNTESDLNTNTAILFSENGLYIGVSPTAGTATPVLTAVTKQDVVLSYSGTASTIHAGG